jgi:O-antigen ligase/tetratricopeptide (TPR) repeat protein
MFQWEGGLSVHALEKILPAISWRSAIVVLLVVSLLVPVIAPTDFFFPYVVPRNLFFRVIVEIAATALILALCFGRKKLDLRGEPIFFSLLAFLAVASVSAILSPAPTHSFFGDFERMGGVWAWLHLVLFFLLLRTLRDQDWGWIVNGALAVSLFVSITAIVQHFQLAAATRSADAIVAASTATLGNPGLLAAYLLMNVALAGYAASAYRRYRLLYLSVAGVNLLGLIYATNRSTIIGLVLGAIVGGVIFAALSNARRKWISLSIAGVFGLTMVGMAVGVRAFPGSEVTRFVPSVLLRLAGTNPAGDDETRTMQWRAAIDGFRDRPLLGYGLENHNLVWGAHFDSRIYGIETDVFDRTHNQFLEILATTGLIGTAAFLGIWIAIGVTLAQAYRSGRLSAPAVAVLSGLQVAYATYLFFWFVDLNAAMIWILIAGLIASRGTVGSVVLETTGKAPERAIARPILAFAAMVILAIAIYGEGYAPLRSSRALALIDSPREPVAQTLSQFEVVSSFAGRQSIHPPMVMSQFIASLGPRLKEIRADSTQRRMLDSAFANSFAAFAREIHRDTLNDRLYTYHGALLVEASRFYGSSSYRQQGIEAFHKAIELSPNRIQPRLLLARVYTGARDYERAVVVLNEAVKTNPRLGEPRYRLAEAYMGAGRSDSALAMLHSSLALGYVGAPETYLSMGKRLEFSGRSAAAAKLYSGYLEAKYTEAVWDRDETIDRPIPTADIAVAAHLPLLYVRARDSELAIKTAAALSAFDPSRASIVDGFVSDIGARRRANWVARNSLLPCPAARSVRWRDSVALGACGVFRRKL